MKRGVSSLHPLDLRHSGLPHLQTLARRRGWGFSLHVRSRTHADEALAAKADRA
jgi:hypothetical protein